ncbi:hypothetical protein F4678DRAFT_246018 [Xylaria arbuscula]|nr:hypothetical protein F4678DRAFT_246018 [Xylaria arbuscula]
MMQYVPRGAGECVTLFLLCAAISIAEILGEYASISGKGETGYGGRWATSSQDNAPWCARRCTKRPWLTTRERKASRDLLQRNQATIISASRDVQISIRRDRQMNESRHQVLLVDLDLGPGVVARSLRQDPALNQTSDQVGRFRS